MPMATAHLLSKALANFLYQAQAPSLVLLAEFIPLCLIVPRLLGSPECMGLFPA